MQFINKKKLNKAFTIIETLVAISIFTSAILGLLSFSAGSISDTNYAKNKLIATYLAQEGLEYMRNVRDTYILFESDGWTGFRDKLAICETDTGCYFDPAGLNYAIPSQQAMKSLTLTACSTDCPTMFYDNSLSLNINRYGYNPAGDPTTFIRKIKVKDVTNAAVLDNKEILIESTVFWKKGDKTFSVSFSNYLKNWAE